MKGFTFRFLVIFFFVLIASIALWAVFNSIKLNNAPKSPIASIRFSELGSFGLFNFAEVSSLIMSPRNCSNESLLEVWNNVFYESPDEVIISKNETIAISGVGCPYYLMYKKRGGELWMLYDSYFPFFIKMRIMGALYLNSTQNFLSNFSINESLMNLNITNLLYFLNNRSLDLASVNDVFSSRFKISPGDWTYDPINSTLKFNQTNQANNLMEMKTAILKDKEEIDFFIYVSYPLIAQTSELPNLTFANNSKNNFAFDLDNYFSSFLKLNYSIYNISGNSISYYIDNSNQVYFDHNNFIGKEQFIAVARNDSKFVESNLFEINIINSTCSDSDGGINHSFAGKVSNGTAAWDDVCIDQNHLREYYCNLSVVSTMNISCPPQTKCISNFCIGNRPPEFLLSECSNINKIRWTENNIFILNISGCFADPDGNNLSYSFLNQDPHLNISANNTILTLSSQHNWSGSGSFLAYASDGINSTEGRVYFFVLGNNSTPIIRAPSLKIEGPNPQGDIKNAVEGENLSFFISNELYDAIEWNLDGKLVQTNSNYCNLFKISSGNHTLQVKIRKGNETDSKIWKIIVEEKTKANKFLFDVGKVMIWVIFIVIGIIIALILWLFIEQIIKKNNKNNIKIGNIGVDLSKSLNIRK